MCLYPILIKNPKYQPSKKNEQRGYIPLAPDQRVLWIPAACGNCEECRKQKAREWKVRLNEEIKTNKGIFVTLTFNQESLDELSSINETTDENIIASYAVNHFIERWRKKYKTSIRHWLVTELGHDEEYIDKYGNTMKATNRLHLHGILFTNKDRETIQNIWKYGYIWIGEYCTTQTINYIIKYILKIDKTNKYYKSKIFTSKGIGSNYLNTWNSTQNRYKPGDTNETYKLPNGMRINLPTYYRRKIYTEQELEKLWIEKLNLNRRFINGIKYKFKTYQEQLIFIQALKYYQNESVKRGYQGRTWKDRNYKNSLDRLNTYEQ